MRSKWVVTLSVLALSAPIFAAEDAGNAAAPAMTSTSEGSGLATGTPAAPAAPGASKPAAAKPAAAKSGGAAMGSESAAGSPAAGESKLSAEIKIGTGVENHDVTGAATSFPAGTTLLVGWSKITGAEQPTEITHVWKLDGKEVASVPLKVQSSSYRTNSKKTVTPGKWTLEVKDAEGHVLGSQEVEVAAQ